MPPNTATIANAFHVVATLLGVPSLAATLLYGFFRVKLWLSPLPEGSSIDGVKNPDAILLILGGMTRAMGAVAGVLGGVSQFVFGILAAIAGVMLVFSVTLFLTGRGLHAHQDWARIVGGLLMAVVLLGSLLSLVALRGPLAVAALGLMAASVYALLGLWRGFGI